MITSVSSWSDHKMIRFLQTPGPTKKLILGGLLVLLCISMLVYLIPSFNSSAFGAGGPAKGVLATVDGNDITTLEVRREARQMVQQQFPRGGAQVAMLLPYFTSQAAERLISRQAILAEAERLGLRATDDDVR